MTLRWHLVSSQPFRDGAEVVEPDGVEDEAATEVLAALADPSSLPLRLISCPLTELAERCNSCECDADRAPAATGVSTARGTRPLRARLVRREHDQAAVPQR